MERQNGPDYASKSKRERERGGWIAVSHKQTKGETEESVCVRERLEGEGGVRRMERVCANPKKK